MPFSARWPMLALTLVATTSLAALQQGCAAPARAERGPGAAPARPRMDGPKAVHVETSVAALNYDARGMLNGIQLSSGELVIMSPGDVRLFNFARGQKVVVDGIEEPVASGPRLIQAHTLNGIQLHTNVASGNSNDRGPRNGPGNGPGFQGGMGGPGGPGGFGGMRGGPGGFGGGMGGRGPGGPDGMRGGFGNGRGFGMGGPGGPGFGGPGGPGRGGPDGMRGPGGGGFGGPGGGRGFGGPDGMRGGPGGPGGPMMGGPGRPGQGPTTRPADGKPGATPAPTTRPASKS